MHTIETINYVIMCLFFVRYAYQFAYIPLAWLPARKRQAPKLDCGSRPVQRPNRRDRACPRCRGVCAQVQAAGALAISAMVLPGISGSSLLMSCGLYLPVITAMKDLLHFKFGQFWLLAAVGLGVLVGFAVAPHWIRGWMHKAPGAVIYAVLGMMLGSLYASSSARRR